ncbi:dynein light chain Tctex-type protein 2B-like [Dreissena polymorpha]|nr:dynein light chain Tctex-type protein 2B-like [Dreissena polymorpha]
MDRRLMITTKPVLAPASKSESADSKMEDNQVDSERRPSVKINAAAVTSVLASFNKMQLLRQRTLAAKGNVTKATPLRTFNPREVKEEIERQLDTTLTGLTYDSKRASVLARSLSDTIKRKVKAMKFPRYKFVVFVTISSKSCLSMLVGSQCVWNAQIDTFATGTFINDSLVAVVTVFAVFQE